MSAATTPQSPGRRGVFASSLVASFLPTLGGCVPAGGDPHRLVIATPWAPALRVASEQAFTHDEGGHPSITWVDLGAHRWGEACDRRGGVDLILGGSPRQLQDLADADRLVAIDPTDPTPWRQVERPRATTSTSDPTVRRPDPRDDPATLAEAKSILTAEGWAGGYATLARRPVDSLLARPLRVEIAATTSLEAVGLVRGGRHVDQAQRFLAALTRRGWVRSAPADAAEGARTDDLLADLLAAALLDARNERRDAQRALAAHGHPAVAEAALGEAPPWPPASVLKLRNDPGRAPLARSLVEQVAPDPDARDWLEASWRAPRRPLDATLLRDLTRAAGGKLGREPRFRAWLRGEWTAWTQQLYRRTARLAGGYRPS